MNNSEQFESSSRQDYVLTSATNHLGNNYLTPLSPNIYQFNYHQAYFDAEYVLSSSPKVTVEIHDVTPHPMNISQISSKKKSPFRFDSDNKQNVQTNFHLFEPLEYQKPFEKKIDFSQMGFSSNKKSPQSISPSDKSHNQTSQNKNSYNFINSANKSHNSIISNKNSHNSINSGKQSKKSISELSNKSKNFIQRSIKQNIIANSSESGESTPFQRKNYEQNKSSHNSLNQSLQEEMRLLQFDFKDVESIPVTSSNETIQTKQNNQNANGPSSSDRQQNTYSTQQVNLESIQQTNNLQNQRDCEEVPSFNEKQEVIDYFLTDQDDHNSHHDSEEGIQLLSELKSELNSLINGSAQNSQASSNNVSRHGRTLPEIRSFGHRSNPESAVSKRCNNACEELASKIQQLRMNIMNLHSKISTSTDSTQKINQVQSSSEFSKKKAQSRQRAMKQVKNSPQIFLQEFKEEKNPKKLIYHDSQIIFSRNDGQFVDFNDEFSKVLGQSYDEYSQNNDNSNSQYLPDSSPSPNSHQKSDTQIKQSKTQISLQNSDFGTQYKNTGHQTDNFGTSSQKTSMRMELEKQAFKMSYPKFYDFQNENDQSGNPGRSPSVDLGNSYISSTSNEGLMLQEINSKFNSRLNQFFRLQN